MQDGQICRTSSGGLTDPPVQHRKAIFTIIRYFGGLMKFFYKSVLCISQNRSILESLKNI